ncbi:MAG: type IV pilin [Methanofollis sp.]|nr:type IV pilin [Methanofollis sp.]
MRPTNDSAVSPVVGVMLMLVVTIVIAAVVSAFAGGIYSDQKKAPQAALSCESMVESVQDEDKANDDPDYPSGFKANNGLLFTHEGGDPFSIHEIQVQIQSKDKKTTIDSAMIFKSGQSCADTSKMRFRKVDGTSMPTYTYKYAGDSGDIIKPGDKFAIIADGCYDNSETASEPRGMFITWQPEGAEGRFEAQLGTKIEYEIVDKASGKGIQKGSCVLY